MSCKNTCQLCPRLVISTAVNYDAGTNSVLIGIPAGTYEDNEKYCLVVAQAIPATATIGALVYVTIGTGLQQYPLLRRNGAQMTAAALRTRTKYSTCVSTSSTTGAFRLLGCAPCAPANTLSGINGTAPTA